MSKRDSNNCSNCTYINHASEQLFFAQLLQIQKTIKSLLMELQTTPTSICKKCPNKILNSILFVKDTSNHILTYIENKFDALRKEIINEDKSELNLNYSSLHLNDEEVALEFIEVHNPTIKVEPEFILMDDEQNEKLSFDANESPAHTTITLQCDKCSKTFTNHNQVLEHKKMIHNTHSVNTPPTKKATDLQCLNTSTDQDVRELVYQDITMKHENVDDDTTEPVQMHQIKRRKVI